MYNKTSNRLAMIFIAYIVNVVVVAVLHNNKRQCKNIISYNMPSQDKNKVIDQKETGKNFKLRL